MRALISTALALALSTTSLAAAEVGPLAPGGLLQKELERSPQVRGDRLIEAGEALRVLRQVRVVLHLQPLQEEIAQLEPRALVGDHPLRLFHHLLARGELTGRGRFEQLIVR